MKNIIKTVDNYTNNVYNNGMKDKEKKLRKDISIAPSVWELAEKNAIQLGLSVSAYITMLIMKN